MGNPESATGGLSLWAFKVSPTRDLVEGSRTARGYASFWQVLEGLALCISRAEKGQLFSPWICSAMRVGLGTATHAYLLSGLTPFVEYKGLTGRLPLSAVMFHELLDAPGLVKLQKVFDSSLNIPGASVFLFWPVCVGWHIQVLAYYNHLLICGPSSHAMFQMETASYWLAGCVCVCVSYFYHFGAIFLLVPFMLIVRSNIFYYEIKVQKNTKNSITNIYILAPQHYQQLFIFCHQM